jgi:hypothetical protein
VPLLISALPSGGENEHAIPRPRDCPGPRRCRPVGRCPAHAALIEGFESGNLAAYTAVSSFSNWSVTNVAAHDGNFGAQATTAGEWIFRNDAGVTVSQGDQLSVWMQPNGAANGRSYFGFGADPTGTLSVVLAGNISAFIIQRNAGFGFLEIGNVPQSYTANTWYRVGVDWGVGGSITARLFASDGTTLLNTVSATDTSRTTGGIAFRGFNTGQTYFDTVERTTLAAVPEPGTMALSGLGMLGLALYFRRRRTRR